MIQLGPRHFLAERVEDLPAPRKGEPIYLDCETRSRHDDLRSGGLQPYLGDRASMWGICFDDCGPAIAVPYRQRDGRNLPVESVQQWLADVLRSADEWRNHNVKFDAHFALQEDGVMAGGLPDLVDTLTLAKLIDSDRYSHGLKDLGREWLHADTSGEERIQAFLDSYKLPHRAKAKDYALVPTDLLGFYNCDDVLINRDLYAHCMREMPESVLPTWQMERQLTPVLFDMERLGLRVKEQELKVEKAKSMMRQIKMATRLNELTGTEFADSSAYSYSLLIGKWGLPILARDKKSNNPTFNADALKLYLVHPEVVMDAGRVEAVKTMLALRDEETYCSLFVESFLTNMDASGYVHSSYNQLVRTGRMSCKEPNTQQFDERAKFLVHADEDGCGFLDIDYSQIEFRLIVHYIKDEEAIKAYNENADTDFHEWVAKMCGIKRKPAKTVNFSTAFGAGKRNIVGQLAANEDIIAEVTSEIAAAIAAGEMTEDQRLKIFSEKTWARGEEIYTRYHERLPTLKKTADRANAIARQRGFVFNLFGRRRHLPPRAAHVAFNTLCQGSAMDIIKRRMIKTAPRNWPELAAAGITMRVNVHDAVVFHGPMAALREWQPAIVARLSEREPLLSVPLSCSAKITEGRWGGQRRDIL